MTDEHFSVNAHLSLSGDEIKVGSTDESVCFMYADIETTYMTISEAEMLIAALRVAIEHVGL